MHIPICDNLSDLRYQCSIKKFEHIKFSYIEKFKPMRGFFVLLLALALAGFYACEQGPHPDYEKTEGGLYYKFHEQTGQGVKPDSGDRLDLRVRWYVGDTVFFDSRDMREPFFMEMRSPRNPTDFFTALQLMKAGDSATFILHPDSLFGSPMPPEMDTVEELYVDIRLLEVTPYEEVKAEQERAEAEGREREAQTIEKFLEQNEFSPERTANGIYILEHKKTEGEPVEAGKILMLRFKGSLLDGTVFQKMSPEFPYVVGETPDYPLQWDEALLQMSKGDHATLLLPFDRALGSDGVQGQIPPFSPLLVEVSIGDILGKEEYQQQQLSESQEKRRQAEEKLNDYLESNNITQQPTGSGLIYITLEEGNGPKPEEGETVSVHYKGYLLNGELFDSSYDRGEPLEIVVGQGGLIDGWLEAIPMMREGEKARIIVPWRLAYGKQGKQQIPPYANLVFEMEMINIKK